MFAPWNHQNCSPMVISAFIELIGDLFEKPKMFFWIKKLHVDTKNMMFNEIFDCRNGILKFDGATIFQGKDYPIKMCRNCTRATVLWWRVGPSKQPSPEARPMDLVHVIMRQMGLEPNTFSFAPTLCRI